MILVYSHYTHRIKKTSLPMVQNELSEYARASIIYYHVFITICRVVKTKSTHSASDRTNRIISFDSFFPHVTYYTIIIIIRYQLVHAGKVRVVSVKTIIFTLTLFLLAVARTDPCLYTECPAEVHAERHLLCE